MPTDCNQLVLSNSLMEMDDLSGLLDCFQGGDMNQLQIAEFVAAMSHRDTSDYDLSQFLEDIEVEINGNQDEDQGSVTDGSGTDNSGTDGSVAV